MPRVSSGRIDQTRAADGPVIYTRRIYTRGRGGYARRDLPQCMYTFKTPVHPTRDIPQENGFARPDLVW